MKPRLLDLFCCEGGAGKGYSDVGFEVVGVDIEPQPRYPFEFIQADALTFPLDGFDVIHASPPCQGHSSAASLWGKTYESEPYLRFTLNRLTESGLPFVVENVGRARMDAATILCGTSFGLGLHRHRRFQTSFFVMAPPCNSAAVRYRGRDAEIFGHHANTDRIRTEWGVPWMSQHGIAQCIPPAFTAYLGDELLTHLSEKAA
jgi:DNA (cytosine-5)-methyltransferase 1